MKLGQNQIVELVYNVRRAQFNAEIADLGGEHVRPSFEDGADSAVVESITAEIRAFYDSATPTGDVIVDAILETLR